MQSQSFSKREVDLPYFFGSGAAHKVQIGIAAYSASRAAEEHLARIVTLEASNSTTLVFMPGIVETRMQKQARESTGGGSSTLKTMHIP
jgi:NAD(P)-dependent dehydrogenase (short-subunit alcohol dehydrogenase family)